MNEGIFIESQQGGSTPPTSTNFMINQCLNIEDVNLKKSFQEKDIFLCNDDCFSTFPFIKDKSVDMILADLPYGTTACSWDSVLDLQKLWTEYKRIIKQNGAIVLTASQPFTWNLCSSNPEWFKYEIIWEKPNGTNPLLVEKQPFKVHENILVFYKKQPVYNPQMTYGHSCYSSFFNPDKFLGEVYDGNRKNLVSKHKGSDDGSRYPRSVQKFSQERGCHPTKKPAELMSWLIRTYTNKGGIVMDNTMGEGTTGMACVQEKRGFIGIEIDFEYYSKALNDIKNMLFNIYASYDFAEF